MKRIFASLILLSLCQFVLAQESFHDHKRAEGDLPKSEGFDPARLFTGGGLSLGYGTTQAGDGTTNNSFNIGAIPEFGYSLSNTFDVGISTSINYTATTNSAYDAKQHYTNYSIGAFARVFPTNNFFLEVMPEQDWGTEKQISSGYTQILKIKSNSFLAGIGFGQRIIGESYFYTLIMVDLGKDAYSPYNSYNSVTGQVSILPVLRGGFNFYPFRKHQK